jgi:hypothetical protein
MTSMTRHYSDAASQARNATDKTADLLTQGAQGLTGLIPRLPQIDLIPAVERYFDLVQRTVDINRYLAVKWVEAAGTLTGAVRDQARERYEGQTKAELSDQLAERDLPKTGTVDELTERLIEADSK